MKITEVREVVSHEVSIEGGDWREYVRYGPNCWYAWMGESLEPISREEKELENCYQSYLKSTKDLIL